MTPRRMDVAGRLRRLRMILRRCRGMGETAVLVVEHLDRLEDKYGRATPSRAGIAAAIGRCERSVSRAVGKLEAAGIVDVWRDKPHAVNGEWCRRRTNMYRLKWPPKVAKAQVDKRGHALHVYAFHEAIEPVGGVTRAAPTPTSVPALTLFGPEPSEEPPPTEPAAPPPWVTEGIERTEWVRRCRT